MSERRCGYWVRAENGVLLLTLFAPNNGYSRGTSKDDLTIELKGKHADQFKADVVIEHAGMRAGT